MCRELGCKPGTLDNYLESIGIKYSGNMGGKGHKTSPARKSALHYMKLDGPFINSHALKIKMLRDGIRERKCERCDGAEWLGEPIPLELHHKNGNRQDNRDENIDLLCPNCHALTDNNSGKANARLGKSANPPDLGSGFSEFESRAAHQSSLTISNGRCR